MYPLKSVIMKKKLNQALSYLNVQKNTTAYEWDELVMKAALIAVTVFLIIKVDMFIYGFLSSR